MSQRTRHNDPGSMGVNMGLIITPMLDRSFQVLSFFIMTYHPSALEAHVNGKLVPPSNPLIKGKEKNTPTDEQLIPDSDPDLEASLQVVVKAIPPGGVERTRSDGQPAQIYIKKSEDADLGAPIADTDEPLDDSLKKLKARLKEALAGPAATMKGNLRLDCGGDMKHRYVMEIFDICKGAGFQNVSFVAPPPEKKKD
jgi:biopolymer transport protein ExbD